MLHNPSSLHRNKKNLRRGDREGTIHSFTVIDNPPAGFLQAPRTVALIEFDDGSKAFGKILSDAPVEIGQRVLPRMQLAQTDESGLRRYEIAYEPCVCNTQPVKSHQEFPGYVLALTGPSGVGKSTVTGLIASMFGEYVERVPILTTREPKDHDGTEYVHVSLEEFLRLKRDGKLAASTEIPSRSELRWYGYLDESIRSIWKRDKIPCVVTEMHLLQELAQRYGRRSILSCGLLPPGKSKRLMLSHLLRRLRQRGRDSEESIEDRIRNAERDLHFFDSRTDLFDHMIVNENLDAVIDTLRPHILKLSRS